MELSKRSKIALGIATLLEVGFPLLIASLYMLVFFLMPVMMAFNPKSEGAVFVFFFIGMMIFFFVMMLFSIFQITMKVLYLIIIIQNKKSNDLTKILFALGTFYVPFLAMPLYYVIFFLKEDTNGESTQKVEDIVSPA